MEYGYGKNFGYSWDYLSCIEMTIELEINAIRKIIDSNEKVIDEIDAEFKKKIQEDSDLFGIKDRHYESHVYSQKYMYDEFLNSEIVSQQINSGCFIIYSALENRLNEICGLLKKEFNIKTSPKKKPRENDLEKFFEYLKEKCGIPLSQIEEPFNKLNNQKFVRNKLYHNNGLFRDSDRGRIHPVSGLQIINETNRIIIDIDFLRYLVQNMEILFTNLIPKIDERYRFLKENN